MKLAICGHGRSGKDAAAEWLARCTPLRYVAGTSTWAAAIVFQRMTDMGYVYADAHHCWLDRHHHRTLWAQIIGQYNAVDPVALYRDCLREQDLLTGVRWRREMQACRSAGLVDAWIWIERPGIAIDETMEFTAADCDLSIINGGTLEAFHVKLDVLARLLGIASTSRNAQPDEPVPPIAGAPPAEQAVA